MSLTFGHVVSVIAIHKGSNDEESNNKMKNVSTHLGHKKATLIKLRKTNRLYGSQT